MYGTEVSVADLNDDELRELISQLLEKLRLRVVVTRTPVGTYIELEAASE